MKQNKISITVILILSLIIVGSLIFGYKFLVTENDYPFVSFNERIAKSDLKLVKANNTKKSDPLRVSLASITSTKESVTYYEELLVLLEKKLNMPVEIVQRKTYSEVNELLRAGEIDMAFICTFSYVSGHDSFGLELLAAPQKDGVAKYCSYILVRQDSGIDSFTDLQGKRFAFTDPMSTTGYTYPMALLKRRGMNPENYFSSYIFTYSHDNSIKAVTEGIVDGAAVDHMVYQQLLKTNLQGKDNLKVVKESPKFTTPPVVVRPGLDVEIKQNLQEFFMTLDESPNGKEILKNMGLDAYKKVSDSDYNSVRKLRRELKE
ncbi:MULTISPECIES: substrate-binding domain-containing protein [unclassified Candidatus Frackibacter]|uniref:substrate-binding domain-containing protein n=1 Tax=unclassified Candidatus Frackibacter TaxID=2648818 RepID=UPI000888C5E3|nr:MULTISPECIES: phosphate/phosphite/phosphonate ABC transporter substrate-binding protein [unclassified Candidatus Frackibacter]SDC00203.1 phosphonate transport system substrate-binding protein [Candidatus Frackibacter sp. WG11]SEM31721.1 phosphonate transport system substrate-binding protein [Candidatus Frackibacter sp. WG12]SFL36641.1 phosphonate transport system substrate-binding protein [Candidatus Frackibacter sp. WG13]